LATSAGHPDHRHPRRPVAGRADAEALAHGVLAGPQRGRGRTADDDDLGAAGAVLRPERASGDDRNSERAEEVVDTV
jgi:hypothetical protein